MEEELEAPSKDAANFGATGTSQTRCRKAGDTSRSIRLIVVIVFPLFHQIRVLRELP
jgi:hypothetical protein